MSRRRFFMPSAALTVVFLFVGCSTDSKSEQNYTVPKSLCGISIESSLLAPFLPEGQHVAVQERAPVPSRIRCQVNVDGKVALIASKEWREQGDDVTDVADSLARIDGGTTAGNGKYLYMGTGAVGRTTSCDHPEHKDRALFTAVQVFADGHGDTAAMKNLITAYTKSVEQSGTCS